MFKPEVPEAQNHGRRLLKHIQAGKQNTLRCLSIVFHLFKGLSANSET